MLLKIANTTRPATDLGFLLRKNPANVHRAEHSFGQTILAYTESTEARCEAALILDVDPIKIVRGAQRYSKDVVLAHYVNDRPYAASSFLSVALNRVLRNAVSGQAVPEREGLAETALELELTVTPLPCRGGKTVVRSLFEPLGYTVTVETEPLDPVQTGWGDSPYCTVTLTATKPVSEALTHLYVLIPVLDNAKHYWVGSDEVEKLITKGGEWLQTHPERELIANRYLRRRHFARTALDLLDERFGSVADEEEPTEERATRGEEALEKPLRLNDLRYEAVTAAVTGAGAQRVCDLGCGEGKLLRRLLEEKSISYVLGVDVSPRELEKAERKLKLERMGPTQRGRIDLAAGSLVYDDERLEGFDAITLVEVIEHVDAERLSALERVVFAKARPQTVIVSTPNIEFNATFENLEKGKLRHADHRFEWTRAEFESWAEGVCERQGYIVRFEGIGQAHDTLGHPTQMAVFTLGGEA